MLVWGSEPTIYEFIVVIYEFIGYVIEVHTVIILSTVPAAVVLDEGGAYATIIGGPFGIHIPKRCSVY